MNTVSATILLGFLLFMQPATPHTGDGHVDAERLSEEISKGSFTSGAESRYQSQMATEYANTTWFWNCGSWAITCIGFIASTFAAFRKQPKWRVISLLIVGMFGVVASTMSYNSSAAARYVDHSILQKRWEVLQGEWDRLELQRGALAPDQLQAIVLMLLNQQSAIQSAEPSDIDSALWDQSWVEEAQVRDLPVPPKPQLDQHASAKPAPQ